MSELALNFDYNANQLQWLLLAPGLINWVTQDTHLGLYRNYFGQDIDDNFIADNEWSSQFQCTPAATDPPDYTCPTADQGVAPGSGPGVPGRRADERGRRGLRGQLGEADRDHAEHGVQRASAPAPRPTAADESQRQLHRQRHRRQHHLHRSRPETVDTQLPQRRRRWSTPCWPTRPTSTGSPTPGRTCSWAAPCGSRRPLTSVTANGSGGSFTAGTYSYEITAATAYGESEPSTAAAGHGRRPTGRSP